MVVPSGDIEFVLHRCVQTIIAMTGYGLLHRLGKRHWQKHDCECAVSSFFFVRYNNNSNCSVALW